MKKIYLLVICCLPLLTKAQWKLDSTLNISAYAELYYSYNLANPSHHENPSFIYNHKRHNEVNLNLALIKASFQQERLRANAGLMVGNYAQYNLVSEPTWAQFINEANLGIKLHSSRQLWLDAGIMPSHIGFESNIGADCWTTTRSILAENSPYYETGIRLSYNDNHQKFLASFSLLNGWQQIEKKIGQQYPAIGIQLNYKPSSVITLNYSNFIGSTQADSLKAIRTYHNIYAILEPKSPLSLIIGFDIGSDKIKKGRYGIWMSPLFILRYKPHPNVKLALRGEYYHDPNEIIVTTGTSNGFQTLGGSLNVDYQIHPYVSWRLEGKIYAAKDKIFNGIHHHNQLITSALTFKR